MHTLKIHWQRLLLALALSIGPLLHAQPGKPRLASTPYAPWEPFIGTNSSTLALPDYHADYFAYSFVRTGEVAYVGLKISGQFGYARYMSYNFYEATQGASLGSIRDVDMQPLAGNVNPFTSPDPQATNRDYVVVVQPAGYANNSQYNTFNLTNNQVTNLTVILRYYVPPEIQDVTADVALPTIEAFDVRTQDPVDVPPLYSLYNTSKIGYALGLRKIFDTIVDNQLRFYHVQGSGEFNNADNDYLINAVDLSRDEVALIWVKPPTFAHDTSEFDTAQVRYWSFNEGSPDTSTPFGLIDNAFHLASDGLAYIAVGAADIQTKAESFGYNFMPWDVRTRRGVILYRNMLAQKSYPGNFDQVPYYTDSALIFSNNATNFIGNYAPNGVKVSRRFFLKYGSDLLPR